MSEKLNIPVTWDLPEEFVVRLGRKAGRQRLMEHEGHLLLILHSVPNHESSDRKAVLFWRNVKGEWSTTDRGAGFACLKEHVTSFEVAIDELEESMEKASSPEDFYKVLKYAVPLARASTHLHNVMQQCREHCKENKEIISLRDEAYESERAAALVRDDARNGLDFEMARQAKEQADNSEEISEAAHRLNILAAFFLPITAIASLLGVNMFTGFENYSTTIPFWIMVGAGFGLGWGLKSMVFKAKK